MGPSALSSAVLPSMNVPLAKMTSSPYPAVCPAVRLSELSASGVMSKVCASAGFCNWILVVYIQPLHKENLGKAILRTLPTGHWLDVGAHG